MRTWTLALLLYAVATPLAGPQSRGKRRASTEAIAMPKHLWAALPSCLLFLATTAAAAASAPTIVAAESGSSTLVAGVVAPDFVSCRNSIGDSTAFVLEESTAALWLADNSTKTAARISAEALKELQGSRVEAINKQQALLAQVE